MSNNPFESPQNPMSAKPAVQPQSGPAKSAMPGAMMTIAIICIILAIFGLIGSCIGGLALAAQGAIEEFVDGIPQPPDQKEFNRMNMGAQGVMMVPGFIMIIINLFVATLLLVGSIGCLQRKAGGRNILNLALLAAIFYSVLKIGVQIYNYFAVSGALNAAVADYTGEVPVATLERMVQANNIGLIVGAVLGVVFALAMMVFYIWAKFYVSKEQTIRFFEAQ